MSVDFPRIEDVKEVYHSSDHLYSKPNYELIVKNRTNHLNGILGLYFSTIDSYQRGFGKYAYKIQIPSEFRKYYMPYKEYSTTADKNEEEMKVFRKELIEKCDVVIIEEFEGLSGMGFFVNVDIEIELMA